MDAGKKVKAPVYSLAEKTYLREAKRHFLRKFGKSGVSGIFMKANISGGNWGKRGVANYGKGGRNNNR